MGKKKEGEASCLSRQPAFRCPLSTWAGRTIFSPYSLFSLPPPAIPAKKIQTASKRKFRKDGGTSFSKISRNACAHPVDKYTTRLHIRQPRSNYDNINSGATEQISRDGTMPIEAARPSVGLRPVERRRMMIAEKRCRKSCGNNRRKEAGRCGWEGKETEVRLT